MASAKTETSELSVAMGLLGYDDPMSVSFGEVGPKFDGTLPADSFVTFHETYPTDNLYKSMNHVGLRLRAAFPPFGELEHIKWTGADRQAATMSTAKDLLAANVPISVKAESRVVGNPSPYNLFVATPQGSAQAHGMASWYLETAPAEYQAFYAFARKATNLHDGEQALAELVTEFEASRNKKRLVRAVPRVSEDDQAEFQALYLNLCRAVSKASAEAFNNNLAKSLASKMKQTVLERIAKMFFRMDAVEYLLCGVDDGHEFAVLIPDLTTWLQTWQFESIRAISRSNAEQPIVDFEVICKKRATGERYVAQFHAEVRWSHGKFSSVEGKLYKEFSWVDLPFFTVVL